MTPDKKDGATKHWTRVFICELESVLKYKGNWFFISLVATGLGMSAYAYLGFSLGYLDSDMLMSLVIDGVAFLVIGVACIIMTRTTQKIGKEIKKALDRNTAQLEAMSVAMTTSMNNMTTSMNNMTTSMNNMTTSMNNMTTSMNNMTTSMNNMTTSMNNMTTSITTSMDGMKDTLGEILKELQNRNGHKPTGKPA